MFSAGARRSAGWVAAELGSVAGTKGSMPSLGACRLLPGSVTGSVEATEAGEEPSPPCPYTLATMMACESSNANAWEDSPHRSGYIAKDFVFIIAFSSYGLRNYPEQRVARVLAIALNALQQTLKAAFGRIGPPEEQLLTLFGEAMRKILMMM